MTKAALGIAAGICGTLIIGYCIYFDRKRRSDPDFKKKLRERRKARKAKAQAGKQGDPFPDLLNHEAVQQFFMDQVQKGELLLGRGEIDGGVEHLANAVAVCGQPNDLLGVLQQTLPTHVFQLLIHRLPQLSKRILNQPCGEGGSMAEDDVE